MTKAEKADVKAGNIPEDWQAHPAKLAQKDMDARWFIKYSKSKDPEHDVSLAIPFFGYKNHISDASCYDGKILPALLDKGNTARVVWGDTAYRSIENEGILANHGFTSRLHQYAPRLNMCLRFRKSKWVCLSEPLGYSVPP